MSIVDPRDLDDRAMLAYWILGDLPRPGWPGRRRVIARRLAQLALVAAAVAVALALARLAIVVAWAVTL